MKIDLCKLFGVEEGEEFKIYGYEAIYLIENGYLYYISDYGELKSYLNINEVVGKNIIKIPKKKQFSQDTLNFFKCIDKKYEWIARDEDGEVWLFKNKPKKIADGIWDATGDDFESATLVNLLLFKEILWEDEEPVYIDDYVER